MSPDSPVSEHSGQKQLWQGRCRPAPSEMCGVRRPHLTPQGLRKGNEEPKRSKPHWTLNGPPKNHRFVCSGLSFEYKPKQIMTSISSLISLSCFQWTSYQESMSVEFMLNLWPKENVISVETTFPQITELIT